MTEFFKNASGSLRYDSSTKLIYQKAEEVPINTDQIKDSLKAIMNFVEKNEVKGLVVDISRVKGTFSMLNEYIATVYTPKIISHGVSFNAVVVSNDTFTKFATDQLVQKIRDFEIRTFQNFADAEAWAIKRAKS